MSATRSWPFETDTRGPASDGRHRGRLLGLRLILAGVLAMAAMAFATPAAQAAPFACDNAGYITQVDAAATNNDTYLRRIARQPDGTYLPAHIGTRPQADGQLNSLGFRFQDGHMYAWDVNNSEIVKIGQDAAGTITFDAIGAPVGAPVGFATYAGDFLQDGTYFAWGQPGTVGIVVDVTTSPLPTVVRTVTPDFDNNRFVWADMAVNPVDGKIYAPVVDMNAPDPGGIRPVRELILSGTTLSLGPVVGDGAPAGSAWFSPASQGVMFQYANAGGLYSTDIATGGRTFNGPGPTAAGVDGAACANTLAVTKNASPRTVTAGTEVTYTHTITSRAYGTNPVGFADQLPAGLTYVPGGVTVTPASFGTPNDYGNTNTLTIPGTMAYNEVVTITARAKVAPDSGCDQNVQNQARGSLRVAGLPEVTILSDDPTTADNPQDATTVRVTCSADVGVVKSASTSPLVPGEEATFTLVATNHGVSTARNVTVTDQLPAQLSFVAASAGCSEAGGTVTCAAGDLAPAESKTFTVTGRVDSSLDRCLKNLATVTTTTPDPSTANNTSEICTPMEGESNISLTKVASSERVGSGGQVMYTLVVRNRGPSDDPGVQVTDALPAGLALVSAQPSQGTCTNDSNVVSCDLGQLKDGGSAQILVTVNVTATTGCIQNTARSMGAHEDPRPLNNQASAQICVDPPPPGPVSSDLEVDKRASVRRPSIGEPVTYRVVVTNNGPDAAPQAKVIDTYNAGATVMSVRTPQGTCTERIPITCELGQIEAGDSLTIRVTIVPRELGRGRNAASVTSCCGTTDPNPDNNLDTADIGVRKVPLQISKVASETSVLAGEQLSYRIRVRNPSGGVARRVRVCDQPGSGLRFVSSMPRADRSGTQRCWTINRLGPRKARTFHVTVQVAAGANGLLTNRATVRGQDARAARARARINVLGVSTPVTG